MSLTASHLKEIMSFFEDDQEINSCSMSAIYATFERGYKDAHAGFEGGDLLSKDARLKKIYKLGHKQGSKDFGRVVK